MRGITQPDGTAEFCEVFFDNARCPKDNVVGGVNNGWKVANSTLAFERGQSATTGYRRFEEEYKHAQVAEATENGSIERSVDPPAPRWSTTRRSRSCKVNGSAFACRATLSGKPRIAGVAALGATNKMFWSEMHQQAMELALDIVRRRLDARRHVARPAGSWPGARARQAASTGYPVSPMMSAVLLLPFSETIWGGTSQIQRNIVGERVLGLPKEPNPA